MLNTAVNNKPWELFVERVASRWPIRCLHALLKRWERAENILANTPRDKWAGVRPDIPHLVKSTSNTVEHYYTVSLADGCSCQDSIQGAPYGWCKHRIALWVATLTPRERPPMTEAQRQSELKSLFG